VTDLVTPTCVFDSRAASTNSPQRSAEGKGRPFPLPPCSHPSLAMAMGFSEGRFGDLYKLGPKIGEGHFGVVREVVEKSTGQVYAAKIMLKSAGASEASRLRLRREVEIGLELSGAEGTPAQGVARTVRAFQDEQRVYVVMEVCRGAPWRITSTGGETSGPTRRVSPGKGGPSLGR